MQSKIIEESEVVGLKVSSLPTRPTASAAFGGRGYTAAEMKAAFDKFPEFILEKLNLLIEDLLRQGDGSYVGSYKTDLGENMSLAALIAGITSGELAELMKIDSECLSDVILSLKTDVAKIKERMGIN